MRKFIIWLGEGFYNGSPLSLMVENPTIEDFYNYGRDVFACMILLVVILLLIPLLAYLEKKGIIKE